MARSRTPALASVAAAFPRDLEASLRQAEVLVRRARAAGAALVVLPEAALGGYPREDRHEPAVAIDPMGPELARLARAAGETMVCVGFGERDPAGGLPFNTAACLSGDGLLGLARKVHVAPTERGVYAPGSLHDVAAFDTPAGRLGMLVCYDKVFPEVARTLAQDGAEIVACLSAWPVSRNAPARLAARDRQARHFDVLDQARAVENQVVWVSANHAGRHGPLRFLARAKVVDPQGRVRASTGGRPGLALARLDARAEVAAARAEISHLSDARAALTAARAGPPASGTPASA